MIRRMTPERLEPGMSRRRHAALLGDLPLEQMGLRGTSGVSDWKSVVHDRAGGAQRAARVVGQDGDQPGVGVSFRHAEERDQPPAIRHRREQRLPKSALGFDRHRGPAARSAGCAGLARRSRSWAHLRRDSRRPARALRAAARGCRGRAAGHPPPAPAVRRRASRSPVPSAAPDRARRTPPRG